MEYRVLSNFWIASQELVKYVFDGAMSAIEFVNSGKELSEEEGALIQLCINTNNICMTSLMDDPKLVMHI